MEADFDRRFGGIGRLYGREALARFRTAHICIVGIGGVGSWTVEALARCGIGIKVMFQIDTPSDTPARSCAEACPAMATSTTAMPTLASCPTRIGQARCHRARISL